jgi:hypothetical protein
MDRTAASQATRLPPGGIDFVAQTSPRRCFRRRWRIAKIGINPFRPQKVECCRPTRGGRFVAGFGPGFAGEVGMGLKDSLNRELLAQRGLNVVIPVRTTVVDNSLSLEIDFLAIDSIGCSFEQLAVVSPSIQGAAFSRVKDWADRLSRRITYLLEQIGPLEFDEAAGEVLIRSTPPDQLPDGTQYYELLLQSHSGGRLTLRRYRSTKGQAGRQAAVLTMTHEVLLKLTDDLVDTVSTATP